MRLEQHHARAPVLHRAQEHRVATLAGLQAVGHEEGPAQERQDRLQALLLLALERPVGLSAKGQEGLPIVVLPQLGDPQSGVRGRRSECDGDADGTGVRLEQGGRQGDVGPGRRHGLELRPHRLGTGLGVALTDPAALQVADDAAGVALRERVDDEEVGLDAAGVPAQRLEEPPPDDVVQCRVAQALQKQQDIVVPLRHVPPPIQVLLSRPCALALAAGVACPAIGTLCKPSAEKPPRQRWEIEDIY